ncbi:MAG: hypothetical protein BJ554DRAFT_1335, partial [Olpidium bornovanus]
PGRGGGGAPASERGRPGFSDSPPSFAPRRRSRPRSPLAHAIPLAAHPERRPRRQPHIATAPRAWIWNHRNRRSRRRGGGRTAPAAHRPHVAQGTQNFRRTILEEVTPLFPRGGR